MDNSIKYRRLGSVAAKRDFATDPSRAIWTCQELEDCSFLDDWGIGYVKAINDILAGKV